MTNLTTISQKLDSFGDEIEDATEETFLLFSQALPSNNLGFVDEKAASVTVELAGREYEIRQSTGLLTSDRNGGTTGAVLWKVTTLLAAWLINKQNVLWTNGILSASSTIVELGCGAAGLLGLALSAMVSHYVLTDQDYVMKLLRENIVLNTSQDAVKSRGKRIRSTKLPHTKPPDRLDMITLDWEQDTVQGLREVLGADETIHLVLLCDCVYNDFLIRPLVEMCTEVCTLNPEKPAVLLIAQQLRSDEVFESWMEALLCAFRVWRLSYENLPESLQSSSGYTVHLAVPRSKP